MKLSENYKKIASVFYDTVYPEIQHGDDVSDRSLNRWWKYLDDYFGKMFKSQWSALKKQKTSGGKDKTYDIIEDYFVEDALMDPDAYSNERKGEQIFKKNLDQLTKDMKSGKITVENKMKLTKTKLKQIIREEIQKMNEATALDKYKKVVYRLLKNKKDMDDQEFYEMAIDYFIRGFSAHKLVKDWEKIK